MDKRISVAIADDHLLIVSGLEAMLSRFPAYQLLFKATSATDLLNRMQVHRPDVLLLDIQMPDGNGIDLSARISREYPEVKIIALTNFDDISYVRGMFRNGAIGYLLKNVAPEMLCAAINDVVAGKQFVHPELQQKMLEETIHGKSSTIREVPLTKREREVLELVAKEFTNQQIADNLFLSIRTVQSHRINLHQKLGVHNTAGLIKEAFRRGLI